jgi:hypothetical protein
MDWRIILHKHHIRLLASLDGLIKYLRYELAEYLLRLAYSLRPVTMKSERLSV